MAGQGELLPELRGRAVLGWPVPVFAVVAMGVLLRVALILLAENRLASCESTVGVMALDILEGDKLPFFYYGTTYNGGGAIEAILISLAFAVFGPAAIAAKLCLLGLWTAATLLFADLCVRFLSRRGAVLALLFFCVGTPFFLEWSLKARGGFAETVLFSIVLIWLVEPPRWLRDRLDLTCLFFGITSGIAIWASEMILAMIPCAAFGLLFRRDGSERARALLWLALGACAGLLPLLAYNLTHDWRHVQQSVLYTLLAGDLQSSPLTLDQLRLSARFVLGGAWPLLVLGIALAGVRLARQPLTLAHVLLAHALLYVVAYWVSGLRFLPVPPSRVLYSLYPGLAVLLAVAVELPPRAGLVRRALAIGAVAIWLVSVSVPVARWIASGEPREAGSWRASWSLTDGEGLYRRLASEGVRVAYANIWTMESLSFASRAARHRDPAAPMLITMAWLPKQPIDAGNDAAIVVHRGSRASLEVELHLRERAISYRRADWGGFLIFSGLPSSELQRESGLPPELAQSDWPTGPASSDGFN